MDALRCTQCGDTRWSLRGFSGRFARRCELCGGQMVPERRMPTSRPQKVFGERRDAQRVDPGTVTLTATRAGRPRRETRPPVGL